MTMIAVIDPGQGQAPPGSGGVTKIVAWAAWIAVETGGAHALVGRWWRHVAAC